MFGSNFHGKLVNKNVPQMFTGSVRPVEVIFYWPKAVLGNFYWPGATGTLLASSPALVYFIFCGEIVNFQSQTVP